MDGRFYLKGTFSVYGQEFPFDMSLNWDGWEGEIDSRITRFFLKNYEKARWDDQEQARIEARERAKEEAERNDRSEYERLKAKYEPTP